MNSNIVKHDTELVKTGGNNNYIIEYYLYSNLRWHIHLYNEDKSFVAKLESISSIELEEFMNTQDEEPTSFGWLLFDYMMDNHYKLGEN